MIKSAIWCGAVLAVLLAVLSGVGCARTTPMPGLSFDEQGRLIRLDGTGARWRAENRILDALQAQWPEGRFAVGILQEPFEDRDYRDERAWRWGRVTVDVMAPNGVSAEQVGAIVGDQLEPQLEQPELLKVTVSRPVVDVESVE